MMYSGSLASPEDVACYEECITDEIYLPSPPSPSSPTSSSRDVPRCNTSGRVTKKGRSRPRSQKQRKTSSPLVMKWLDENYETVKGACLPRSVLYTHYQDFCKRSNIEPSSAASFGKIIRFKFPSLTTRRLGTRGQSKYHYYGLSIKETSMYYRSVYSKKGLTRFSGAVLKRESGQFYNPNSKTGIILPDFPRISELNFTKPFPVEKVETFLLMYRAHCQRILDAIVRTNFREVQDFLIHFWQGMPSHMLPILSSQATVDLVVVCDFILYRTICEVLIPATLQPLPDSLSEDIVAFSHNLVEWLFGAMQDLPAALGMRKVQTADLFGKSLKRQTALVQLAKGARNVLRSSENVTLILNEWRCIDFEATAKHATYSQQISEGSAELIKEFALEMEQLFVKQSSLEVYFEWLDSVIERRVSEPADKGLNLVELSQDFLITLNYFFTSVEKEVMLMKGRSFEHYRMVHMVLDEYVNYVMELLQGRAIEKQYHDVLKVHGRQERQSSEPHNPSTTVTPPVFPPTPDHTPVMGDREFFSSYETKISTEFQDTNPVFTSALNSPAFTTITDSFCDSFFKHELSNYRSPCSAINAMSLSLNTREQVPPFFENTPMTPQSSTFSGSSPLSHSSVQSPEPSAADLEFTQQNSCRSSDSDLPRSLTPDIFTGTVTDARSSSSSSVHSDNCTLDIAASLELVAEGNCTNATSYDFIQQDSAIASPFSSCCSPHIPSQHGTHPYPTYSQYDFELLQLMSSTDDLLVEPLIQSPAPATPIH